MDMQFELTAEQAELVQRAIADGRLQRPEDAMQEALSLWTLKEQRRSEILAAVDKAETSLAQGKGRTITSDEGFRQLAEDIKERVRARFHAEQPVSH